MSGTQATDPLTNLTLSEISCSNFTMLISATHLLQNFNDEDHISNSKSSTLTGYRIDSCKFKTKHSTRHFFFQRKQSPLLIYISMVIAMKYLAFRNRCSWLSVTSCVQVAILCYSSFFESTKLP